jgi:TetR/AcrR family transcriptional repressor of multidrug resistance operon
MAAIAQQAGVAAGTAYVHYDSKDALVMATYLEVKTELSAAAMEGYDPDALAADQFRSAWLGAYRHLAADPARARFLTQVEASPYAAEAHRLAMQRDDPLAEASQRIREYVVELPALVIWDLGFGPAIRLAANEGAQLDAAALAVMADACWRAISQPD